MDARTLSCLIDLQQSIETNRDTNTVAQQVVHHATNVANANGIAVAILKADELVYQAGSGTAASRVGRHLKAVLSMSPLVGRSGEILRVENAKADGRIEAEICRQLGATSLLILPIGGKQVLLGVMEISFNEAHTFQGSEVRAYQLMAQFVGRAILGAADLRSKSVVRTGSAMVTPVCEQATSRTHRCHQNSKSANENIWESPMFEDLWLFSNECNWFSNLRHAVATLAIAGRLKVAFSNHLWLNRIGIALAISVVLVSWIAYDHNRASPDALNLARPIRTVETLSKPSPARRSGQRTMPGEMKKGEVPTSSFRMHAGPNEIDYIADDVTVRKFTHASPTPRIQAGNQVKIGDDVTVRYFAYKPLRER